MGKGGKGKSGGKGKGKSGGKSSGKSGGKSSGKSGSKSGGKGAGKSSGKSSSKSGGKGAGKKTGSVSVKGKGKTTRPSKSGGKGKQSGARSEDSGKGAGKGKGKGDADKMTRKERKGKGKGKGLPKAKVDAKGKGDEKLGVKAKLKGEKRKRKDRGVDKERNDDGDADLSRWERRRRHFKETAKELKRYKAEVDDASDEGTTSKKKGKKRLRSELEKSMTVKCRNSHAMERRTANPAGYQNAAACDVCGIENILKKKQFFFHCSFCRFDICPKCSEERMMATKKAKKGKDRDADTKSVPGKRKPESGVKSEFTRARREIWLPSDDTAVNRAPAEVEIVSNWVEGMPV